MSGELLFGAVFYAAGIAAVVLALRWARGRPSSEPEHIAPSTTVDEGSTAELRQSAGKVAGSLHQVQPVGGQRC